MSTHKTPPSKYISPQPNRKAPNAPSSLTYTLITSLAYLLYLSLLIPYISYHTFLHLLTPRPFPTWTLSRRISTRLNKLWVTLIGYWIPPSPGWDEWNVTSSPGQGYLDSIARGEVRMGVARLQPVDEKYIMGIADVRAVTAEVRAGFWIDPTMEEGEVDRRAEVGERVLLHIHGGSYIRGHPLWTPFPMNISRSTSLRCLSINYRKTLSPQSAFPAPLLDVLSAYIYLTRQLNFPPKKIIILAESAGAHLALLLSQYLRDLDLPQMGYMVLSSPWADFTLSYPSYRSNAGYCQLSPIRLGRAVMSATRYYTREFVESGYASPAKMPLGGWRYLSDDGEEGGTKVYMHYGGRELFRDEIEALGRGMKRDGVDVRMRLVSSAISVS
uniref:Alpha/beta hydrolase fold-3 domain-containing protein n=1 Tax=Kwoniella bestiolae CBS 10118 TaxID=1296100 RepID=A0A1B9FWW2_9TREE|nr:hypothetical protein I302_07619 [Kwoniella bestiolae CBS 10118]OCF23265.1 hypothetical protein I302_07619 [Kwoniella bestiolae CBS 10118]